MQAPKRTPASAAGPAAAAAAGQAGPGAEPSAPRVQTAGTGAAPLAAVWALAGCGVLAGVALQLQMPALWPGEWVGAGLLAVLALAALVSVLLGRLSGRLDPGDGPGEQPAAVGLRRSVIGLRPWATGLLALGLAAALAFAYAHGRAALRLADALPPALEGVDLWLEGRVVTLPRVGLTGARFVFAVDRATRVQRGEPALPAAADAGGEPAAVAAPSRVWLGWYRGPDEDALLGGPDPELRAGQRWRLPVRLRQPHGPMNPHGFDGELWLFEQGIRATGYVRSRHGALAQRLLDAPWASPAAAPVQQLRQHLRDAIALRVADPGPAGVLAALAVGDQAAIERADWDIFRTTGVAHLMAISGVHVTMFAWLAAAAIGRLWRCWPRALLALPAQQAARWGGVACALAYALLAGWGVPAQRTVLMLAVVALLRSAGAHWPMPAVLLAAAVAVTLADPWALLQPGFWLSFVAVGLLAASEPVRRADSGADAQPPDDDERARWRRWLAMARQASGQGFREGLRSQWVATIGLAPLSLLFFQQLSLVGLLANLLAIPLVTLLITPLSLLGALLPPLWTAGAVLVQALTAALQWLGSAPQAVWLAAAAPSWAVACGLLGALLAVLPLPWRLRALALPLMLPLLAPPVARPPPGHFEWTAVDVGQGTAVLVRTARHLLVYDTGPAYAAEGDAGARLLLPLLQARGERQVDVLMLSHRDTDHVGGAASLLAALPVRQLISSLAPGHPLLAGVAQGAQATQGAPVAAPVVQPCSAGSSWQWDGVQFELLHPLPGEPDPRAKPNSLSCVLRVRAAGGTLLLTGDIEAAQEAALVARAGPALRSTWMLVPHHGSRTSSSAALLAAVQPQVAVVQAAYRSRFGHPAPEVLARYAERGIPVLRSDRCGAYSADTRGGNHCERDLRRRYWHHPGQLLSPPPPIASHPGSVR